MASVWDRVNPFSGKSWTLPIANKKFRKGAESFLFGSPEVRERISTLRDEQEPLYQQLTEAGMGKGAGGAYGSAADFYYDIMNNDPEMLQQLFAPEMRRFNEDIIPGLAEQFAGMGSGALSSSGFRNSATQAGTDLSERLAQMRMGLRQNAAQGLQNIGQAGLGNYSESMVTQPGTQGFLPGFANTVGNTVAQLANPTNWMGGSNNKAVRNTSPYGGGTTTTGGSGVGYKPHATMSGYSLPSRGF